MHHPCIPESGLKTVMLLPPGLSCVAGANNTWGWSPDAGVPEACLAGDGSGVVMDATDMLLKEPTREPMEEVSLKAMGWLAMADADTTWGWSPDAGVPEACLAWDGSGVAMDATDMLLIEPTREPIEEVSLKAMRWLAKPPSSCPKGWPAREGLTGLTARRSQPQSPSGPVGPSPGYPSRPAAGEIISRQVVLSKRLESLSSSSMAKLVQLCVTASVVDWLLACSMLHNSLKPAAWRSGVFAIRGLSQVKLRGDLGYRNLHLAMQSGKPARGLSPPEKGGLSSSQRCWVSTLDCTDGCICRDEIFNLPDTCCLYSPVTIRRQVITASCTPAVIAMQS